MSHLKSDPGLRRLVVELAALPPGDRTAILAALDVRARQTVEALLAEFAGPTAPEDQVCAAAPLSPWLTDRMADGDGQQGVMTAQARQMLSACAAQLFPPASSTAPSARRERPTLVDRVGQFFGGRSRA